MEDYLDKMKIPSWLGFVAQLRPSRYEGRLTQSVDSPFDPSRAPTMDDLARFCCLNSDCPEHGKRGAGNLTVSHRYGPGKSRRMLRCRACKARFSERKGTPLFGSHLPPEKAISILHHIAEGNGVRKTGRLVGVNRETVARYGKKAGAHAAGLHDELVAISPSHP
jgi:LacI family transcriptional regulator